MIDWIRNLISSTGSKSGGAMDQELLLNLRNDLKECEALYRAGAKLCAHVCPEKLKGGPEKFTDLMVDLHRGLLVKIFVEIAHCDRRWHQAEREAAMVLLQHVWSVDVDSDNIVQILQSASDLAETLQWESLLKPFVRLPPLTDQIAELTTLVIRITNIIAKADGNILPGEAAALASIGESMEKVFSRRTKPGKSSRSKAIRADEDVSQVAVALQSSRKRDGGGPASDGPVEKKTPTENKSRGQMLKEAMVELDGLIGLESVKKDLRELIAFLKIQDERERQNLARTSVSLHTIFRGNPGTGKTTVARILGGALGGLGIVAQGHTVETDRSGLVARYAGQTGPRVNERVDEALDGVLFIDEAYSLVAEKGDDQYGDEAVQVLLKRMEDDRHRLVVILAGYPEPMERMLCSNPGLSSRFQRTFDFPDYTADELVLIFESMCRKNQYVLSSPAKLKLQSAFQHLTSQSDERFGNARLARNMFEQAVRRLANRIISIAPLTRETLVTLLPDDIHVQRPGREL